MTIYDGNPYIDEGVTELVTLTGSVQRGLEIESTTKKLSLHFSSDNSITKMGFHMLISVAGELKALECIHVI